MLTILSCNVEGICSSEEEYKCYLQNIAELPAQIISHSTGYNEYAGHIMFNIKYRPLQKIEG